MDPFFKKEEELFDSMVVHAFSIYIYTPGAIVKDAPPEYS
jgi:hypothetical protein